MQETAGTVQSLRARAETAEATITALRAELAAERARMDWLVGQDVEVRTPLVYGSRHAFTAQHVSGEGDEEYRTDLRDRVDAAIRLLSKEDGTK